MEGSRSAVAVLDKALSKMRPVLLPAIDVFTWAVLLYVITLLRLDLKVEKISLGEFWLTVAIAATAQVALGYGTVLYRTLWRIGSFEEAKALALTVGGCTVILLLCQLPLRNHTVPLSAVVVSGPAVLVVAAAYRAGWRMLWEYRVRPSEAQPAIVYGAGVGGQQIVSALLTDPSSPYRPVALLDDDPNKQNLRIKSIRVEGRGADLSSAAEAHGASVVIVAIPSAGSEFIREVIGRASDAGLTVLTVPPVSELFSPAIGISDIRPVSTEDLLGRRVIDTQVEEIAGYLQGRRVLVTGAGGSIGSELCRQIIQYAPSDLIMLDRDESGLHEVQLSIEGRAMLDKRSLVVCDIRDEAALQAVFEEHRPEVVFHAAALKHLPLLEMWPVEAIKTNVLGTQHVIAAAARGGVLTFINISTDKAANPVSVLGYTKRIAERLTAAAGTENGDRYLSVRFGNVLGSRGSVLTTFKAQIEAGGPVTVTDPEVTRYFMTIEEAVQLVIQAGAIGNTGEVLVLDMGKPVRIAEVAHRLIDSAPQPVDVIYTGLRPGEKLHEELLGAGEVDERPRHHLISQVPVPALSTHHVAPIISELHDGNVVAKLRKVCDQRDEPTMSGFYDAAGALAKLS
jgi:FlaA1/EpsC-like NDP-sugar epimerase